MVIIQFTFLKIIEITITIFNEDSFVLIKTWSAEKEVQHGQNDRNLEDYSSADLKILKKLEATAVFCLNTIDDTAIREES